MNRNRNYFAIFSKEFSGGRPNRTSIVDFIGDSITFRNRATNYIHIRFFSDRRQTLTGRTVGYGFGIFRELFCGVRRIEAFGQCNNSWPIFGHCATNQLYGMFDILIFVHANFHLNQRDSNCCYLFGENQKLTNGLEFTARKIPFGAFAMIFVVFRARMLRINWSENKNSHPFYYIHYYYYYFLINLQVIVNRIGGSFGLED